MLDRYKKLGTGVAIVAIILGLGVFFMLSKRAYSTAQLQTAETALAMAVIEDGVQQVTVELQPNAYGPIVVQKGVPVVFNLHADEENINSCNATLSIPLYGQEITLKPGDNLIRFTPDAVGTVPYSCWMGMVNSSIIVVDDLSQVDESALSEIPIVAAGASCCGQGQQ